MKCIDSLEDYRFIYNGNILSKYIMEGSFQRTVNPTGVCESIHRFADDAYDDIRSLTWRNFYASSPSDVMLRRSMQSPALNPAIRTLSTKQNQIFAEIQNIVGETPTIVSPGQNSSTLLLLIALFLLILILCKYWVRK
ncbi:MAG: hypothetical protein QW303_00260 [Nitrososphaerota archaeon]